MCWDCKQSTQLVCVNWNVCVKGVFFNRIVSYLSVYYFFLSPSCFVFFYLCVMQKGQLTIRWSMWSPRRYQVEWDNLLEGSSYCMSYKNTPLLSDYTIKECAKYRTSYSRVTNHFLRQVWTMGHWQIWMRILWGQKWVMDRAAFVNSYISITHCDMFAGFLMVVIT